MANMLLVDNDKAVVQTVRAALESHGHQVEHAWDVKEAMAKIHGVAFEAALLDPYLKEEQGLELLKLLKERSPTTVAIIHTSYGSLEGALEAIHAGAYDYLVKPCDLAELMICIERGLEWQRVTARRIAHLVTANADLARVGHEQKRLLRAAEQQAIALKKLDHYKEEWTIAIAHDLRNSLTMILGNAEISQRFLAQNAHLEEIPESLAVIKDQAMVMAGMLDDFLDGAFLQDPAFVLRKEPCDLRDCTSRVLNRFPPPQRKRIEVRLPAEPIISLCERGRMEQVLLNLIGNALKYSAEDRPVEVLVDRREEEVEIAVTDQGIGVRPEDIPHLFQRFYRTGQARASGAPGMGLGLYLCHSIIAAHGGRLWAESPGDGLGATFRFTLPVTITAAPLSAGANDAVSGDYRLGSQLMMKPS